MARFGRGARQWARDVRTAAVIAEIQRATDRVAALSRLRSKIDDPVISGLANLSYAAWRDGDRAGSRSWADLAVEASLLGGTSAGRAEALTQRVVVTLDDVQAEDAPSDQRLQAAESAAIEALAIYTEAGQADDRVGAQLFIARLREARGDGFGAFEAQLRAAVLASASTDPATRAGVFRGLCPLYWELPEDQSRAGAELLIRDLSTLVDLAVDPRTLADLLDAAGHAYRELQDTTGQGFAAWTRAAAGYRDLGAAADEFLVRSRMFEYAVQLGDETMARELGEACVAAAPPDTSPEQLADSYHLLGATYFVVGQADDAVSAYRKAISLHLSYPEGSGAASTLFLELGLSEADAGRFEDARRDLESVTSGGDWGYWLMDTTLADICYQHLDDLGSALRYAESALELAISSLGDMLCRAHSLYQEATLRAKAGDMETAYRRFTQLMPILDEHRSAEPILVHISPLYARPVPLPSRAECAQLGSLAARAVGRLDEARAYEQAIADFAADAPADLFPADFAAGLQELGNTAVLDAVRELRHARSLRHGQPRQALAAIATARALLGQEPEPYLAAHLAYTEGACYLRLRDLPAAIAAFEQAIAAMPAGSGVSVRIDCYQGLAFIAAAQKRYADGYRYLTSCTGLIEGYRSSLARVEDRMAFLRDQIPVYELLVACCVALNLPAEAFGAVQQVKSRALTDLLAQPVHQPIDYALEGRATRLQAGREDWVAEYLADRPRYSFDDPEDYQASRDYQMRTDIIERSKQGKELAEERQARGLLEELHKQTTHVSFAEARELLRL